MARPLAGTATFARRQMAEHHITRADQVVAVGQGERDGNVLISRAAWQDDVLSQDLTIDLMGSSIRRGRPRGTIAAVDQLCPFRLRTRANAMATTAALEPAAETSLKSAKSPPDVRAT